MEEKYTFRDWTTVIFWRILKNSLIFRIWYNRFLNDLMYDLEIYDIDRTRITEKYQDKLDRFNGRI